MRLPKLQKRYILGSDFPDEFTHSKYTKAIRGANEKAKANSNQFVKRMQDYYSQLLVLANMESYNAILIGQGKAMSERIVLLRELVMPAMVCGTLSVR